VQSLAKTKGTKKPKAKRTPVQTPAANKPQRDYTPELAEWIDNAKGEYTFDILEFPPDPNARSYTDRLGSVVATVTVSDSFTPQSAEKIARLMAHAPELWHALKEITPWLEFPPGLPDGLEVFMKAWNVLMESTDRNPYEPLQASDEEPFFRKFNHPDVIGVDHQDRVKKLKALEAAGKRGAK
jgi:hypothetical protein